jgi:hypothetical protein
MKWNVQNQKQKNKVEEGTVSKDLFLLQTTSRVAGQKRKQIKVSRPKSATTKMEEKEMPDNISKAIVLGGNNPKPTDSCQALGWINDDVQIDSYKKQKKDLTFMSPGSADQVEAAPEQPRHTP